jgi:hypothetical protein
MKLEFSQQILEKYLNIKVHKNPSIWGPMLFHGDRHDEANTAFHNFANAPNNMSPRSQYSL